MFDSGGAYGRGRVGTAPIVSDTAPPRCIVDLLVSDAAARRSAYVDLAITCPVASAHLTAAARRRGPAASVARRVKERRYAASMASLPCAEGRSRRFQPFIVESFGHVDMPGLEWLRKCFAEHPTEYLVLLRRFSISLWRYSSHMLAEARQRRLGLQASLPSSQLLFTPCIALQAMLLNSVTEYLALLRRLSVSLLRYSSHMLSEARHRRLGLHASNPSY